VRPGPVDFLACRTRVIGEDAADSVEPIKVSDVGRLSAEYLSQAPRKYILLFDVRSGRTRDTAKRKTRCLPTTDTHMDAIVEKIVRDFLRCFAEAKRPCQNGCVTVDDRVSM
jgi:hypothetical protein